jgi:regulatory protein
VRITSITEHPRKPGRYVVEVDGQEFAVVAADGIGATRVRVGDVLDEPRADLLRELAAESAMHERALRLLTIRARSTKELQRKLFTPGESMQRVERVLARLTAAGLLDDAGYARQVARSKVHGAGVAKRRLQQELFKRGVAREVADDAIASVMDDEAVDEGAVAERAARKRMHSLAKLDPATRRRRLYAYLARRGYGMDAIRRAMAAVDREGAAGLGDAAHAGDETT